MTSPRPRPANRTCQVIQECCWSLRGLITTQAKSFPCRQSHGTEVKKLGLQLGVDRHSSSPRHAAGANGFPTAKMSSLKLCAVG
jgi:hypothetical protein